MKLVEKENLSNKIGIYQRIEFAVLSAVLFLFPLFLLNSFSNPFVVPKLSLVAFAVVILVVIKTIGTLFGKENKFSSGRFDIPVIVFALVVLASAIVKTPNKMEAFFFPGSVSVILAGTLLYFLINQKKKKTVFLDILLASATTASILIILSFTKVLELIPQLPAFIKDASFNTFGNGFVAGTFIFLLVPYGIIKITKIKEVEKKILISAMVIVSSIGASFALINTLKSSSTPLRFAPLDTTWSVAVETIKENPVLGIGAGNYLTAFSKYLPLKYNQTEFWAMRFNSGRDFYLNIMTEAGLLGIITLVILVFSIVKSVISRFKKDGVSMLQKNPEVLSLLALLTYFLFFPTSLTLTILFYCLLGIYTTRKTSNFGVSSQKKIISFPALLFGLPIIVAAAFFFTISVRVIEAEAMLKRAAEALTVNDAQVTYDSLKNAVRLNPKVDRYRVSLSQVELALARGLAQKKDVTDEDRQLISKLVQQSIEESKSAVSLNPQRAQNWELLARTYQSIMAFAKGADQFAIASFSQAIALDPVNPNLRIALGGVYYALGDFDNAIQVFKLAALAKPDLANTHYNLSAAYREKGDSQNAINEMTTVLSLVKKDSPDYELAKAELENLEQKKAAQEEQSKETENLTPPKENQEILNPPLNLPEGSEPPKTQ